LSILAYSLWCGRAAPSTPVGGFMAPALVPMTTVATIINRTMNDSMVILHLIKGT
jgi:hypothetical protein